MTFLQNLASVPVQFGTVSFVLLPFLT